LLVRGLSNNFAAILAILDPVPTFAILNPPNNLKHFTSIEMTYELAKQLKDAGFPNDWTHWNDDDDFRGYIAPTLSELIEACGDRFYKLYRREGEGWYTQAGCESIEEPEESNGATAEEAVAKLWLALNSK
jgi:hypothetical protein